jgi:caffeoyl-CoA O-methyltransferase
VEAKMKKYIKIISLVIAVLLVGGIYSFHLACAKDGPNFKKMSDQQKWSYRETYIENFKRLGLNTTPQDAKLLRILIQSRNAQKGIEVGTANGFGALHMGMGFEATGGHLYSLEIDPAMVAEANEHLKKVGLENTVSVIEGDALEVLPTMEGQFDYIFLDAVKMDYLKYLKVVEPKLLPGAVIVADNVIRFHDEVKDFMDYIKSNPDYDYVTIQASEEKRDGLAIVYKRY